MFLSRNPWPKAGGSIANHRSRPGDKNSPEACYNWNVHLRFPGMLSTVPTRIHIDYRFGSCLLGLWILLAGSLGADEIQFVRDLRPILRERCFACHGALKQEASLRLDSAAFLRKGGDSGEVIQTGDVAQSEILLRVLDPDPDTRMPPEGQPLSSKEIETLREWIAAGAVVPPDDFAESSPGDHWAFQSPKKTAIDPETGINPIDQLLDISRRKNGLPVKLPEAGKTLLLRRVYLDLVGVPPTLKEMNEFVSDPDDRALEKVVDRLLASPHYGERWGRHWMDVWRYTDWYGLGAQLRNSQKHIWHWRDWIIESLNADKGYDQMIREMLAADELYPDDLDRLRATGFLARNYYLFNRTTWLDSTIEHTSKAFLGLTTNCAKCHDHKYDPISQEDYYRMRAIFEPHQVRLDPLPGTTDLEKDGLPRVFDAHPGAKTYLDVRGDEKNRDTSREIAPDVPAFFAYRDYLPAEVKLPGTAVQPVLRDYVLKDRLAVLEASHRKANAKWTEAKDRLKKLTDLPKKTPGGKTINYNDYQLEETNSFIEDSFDRLDPGKWKVRNGNWKIARGQLVQSVTGPQSHVVETIANHPPDFLLETRLSVSGGQMWKSFGIRFDATPQHEKTVYLSAYSESKLQVSYSNQQKTTYPPEGLARLPVELNQSYLMRVAVRGRAINVSVDGKHLVSYVFPGQRQTGKLNLMSFDSIASFDSIRVIPLPENVRLLGADEGQLSPEQTRAEVKLAAAELQEIQAKRKRLEAVIRADLARAAGSPAESGVTREAARSEIQLEIASQERLLAATEAKLLTASQKERVGHEKTIRQAQQRLESLQVKLKKPGHQYESIRASRKALEGPDEKPDSRNQPYPSTSTGRRTALANWMIHPSNPLTARVAVNQIWMRHFGRPLVDPVTDFGRRAPQPVQQQLLDWLAVDLVENGWKMKRLHRMILLSRVYRLSGMASEQSLSGGNSYYLCRTPIRMESQVIRDSLLKLSGQLEEKLGGPPIDPASQASSSRRSLYFRQSRDHQHKFIGMFDDADILRCYRRQESIIPQQALTLANSRIAFQAASKIAGNLSSGSLSDRDFAQTAFQLILCRKPDSEEVKACTEALDQFRLLAQGKENQVRTRTLLVLGLLNSNDFITIR